MSHSDFDKLLKQNTEHLSKLNDIVQQSLKEEEVLVNKLLNPEKEKLSFAVNLSNKIARFGGSWKFIIGFGILLVCWVLFNIFSPNRFDAYPFILMNLLLSSLAALQAPFIMMSQNRQAEKDRQKSDSDYMINLKAELDEKNKNMKQKMMEYKEDGKDNWIAFKSEFNHDMDEMGKAFKDLTVNNVKK